MTDQPDIRHSFTTPVALGDALELASMLESDPHQVLDPAVILKCAQRKRERLADLMSHLNSLNSVWQYTATEPEAPVEAAPRPVTPRKVAIPRLAPGVRTTPLGVDEADPNAKGWSDEAAPTRL